MKLPRRFCFTSAGKGLFDFVSGKVKMKNRFSIYFNLIVIVGIDIILLGASWYAAFLLRYNFDLPVDSSAIALRDLPGRFWLLTGW